MDWASGSEDGRTGAFDVVIGADGIHCNTRRLVFGDESQYIRHLGPCVGIY
jgi:2-polyprenyl-6-methoxyphenol hydroxylase-like FAD-dependent oxidoreductase